MTDHETDSDAGVRASMTQYYAEHPDLDTDGVFSLVYALTPAQLRSVILEFAGAFTSRHTASGERQVAYNIIRRYRSTAGLPAVEEPTQAP